MADIQICYVGLKPYGLELLEGIEGIKLIWPKNLPLEELLEQVSHCDIGISLWKDKGNNYYGDPGKTKLYSACGLPVIMTDNTPYAKIIKKTGAGLIIPYKTNWLDLAIRDIILCYDFYKNNVKKTWKYINVDKLYQELLV